MKSFFICILFLLPFSIIAQTNHAVKKNKPEPKVKQFWFVMLTKGQNRKQDSATAATIQEGHLKNINRLYKEGILKVAGPFGDESEWMGIFVLDCPTKKDAEKYVLTDPAIKAGRLNYEIHQWYTAPIGSFSSVKSKKQ